MTASKNQSKAPSHDTGQLHVSDTQTHKHRSTKSSLKVNDECITDKNEIRELFKEFWEDVGGVGEVLEVREGCLTLERKDGNELNVRVSREEVEKCVKRQKNGKAAGPDDIPYKFYKNVGDRVIDRMTELFNQV